MRQEALFQLLKSLNKGEKRQVKLLLGLSGGKKMIQLYSHLSKMNHYNEEVLRKKLEKEGVKKGQFAVLKHSTYQAVMRALRYINDDSTLEIELGNLIIDTRILEARGLYAQGENRLKKAKQLSIKYEKFLHTLEILQLEIPLAMGRETKALRDKIAALNEVIEDLVEKLRIEFKYWGILQRIFAWYRTKSKIRTKESATTYEKIESSPLLEDANLASTFQSRISYFFSHALIQHTHRRDMEKANSYYSKVIEIWDRYPHMKPIHTIQYKIHLSNYLNSCHVVGKYENFERIVDEIEGLPVASFDEAAEVFQNVAHLRLLYLMNTFQYQEGRAYVTEIEIGLEKYSSKINNARLISFYCNLSIFFFVLGDLEQADHWVNAIFTSQVSDIREDIQVFIRVLHLVIHYELHNYLLLESIDRSVRRKLRDTNSLSEFELLVLQVIRELQKQNSRTEKRQVAQEYLKKFHSLNDQELAQRIVGLEEISLWIESKSRNKPYLEVLREKQLLTRK
ncbi:MAG: hypothetical protein AAFP77_07520 [Bacteroidota bacterium]